jgi:uncharacterized protein (TIGR02677 family)
MQGSDGEMDGKRGDGGLTRAAGDLFRYIVEKNAPIYRAIIDVFVAAKARYRIQLRVDEVARELRTSGRIGVDELDLTRHLDVLAGDDWGNLKRTFETRDAATLADFYRRRSLYQLTPEGEEAHKGVVAVERIFDASGGRLSSVMLPAIADRLEAVRAELETPGPDAARLYTLLNELHGFSTELAENARRFMNDLADSLANLALTDDAFLAYKRAVLLYLESFISELNRHQPRIVLAIAEIERIGADRLIALAASADEAPAPDGTRRGPLRELSERWTGLRAWFSGSPHRTAEVEHLRDATRDAIGRILRVLERLNEKRFLRVNRTADFLRLAQWFATAAPAQAHQLHAVAFGLYSARHFELAGADEEVARGESWWDAEPVAVAPRLRQAGRRSNPGRPGAISDYSSRKKAALADLRQQEARAAEALKRFLGRRARLSELGTLERSEFDVFLGLLDAALRAPEAADGSRTGVAMGQYVVTLLPSGDNRPFAIIETDHGRFISPDFVLDVATRDVVVRHARRVS